VCINAANVFCRYFFLSPFTWAEELMLFLMILTVFTGAASVTWRQEHIRIEAFVNQLSPQHQNWAVAAAALVALVALSTVIITGYSVVNMLYRFDQRSDAMEFPMWIAQTSVPAGLGLIIFLFLLRAFVPRSTTQHGGH
jgi:C4-dicarboxylate transporter DctQ subunit